MSWATVWDSTLSALLISDGLTALPGHHDFQMEQFLSKGSNALVRNSRSLTSEKTETLTMMANPMSWDHTDVSFV